MGAPARLPAPRLPGRHPRAVPLAALCLTLLAGCAASPPPSHSDLPPIAPDKMVLAEVCDALRRDLLGPIEAVREKHGIVGLSLAVFDDRQVLWAEGFGYADRERGMRATPQTVYRVGSIAKPFTAAAVMQLEEKRAVDIDQPLFLYLPEFEVRSRFNTTLRPITVRHLLTHHSGLPTDLSKGMWSDASFASVAPALREEYVAYPPDLVFSYSNVGYTLLGHLIQSVTKTPFTDYMRSALFEPMGMTDTAYAPTSPMRKRLAAGYRDGEARPLLPIRDLPAYGLYSTALDLSRFGRMLLSAGQANGRRVLYPGTVAEMMEVQNAEVPLDLRVRIGLGWFLEKDSVADEGYVVRHGGTTMLFAGELVLLPERNLGAVVLANTHGSRRVVSHIAEDLLRLAIEGELGLPPGESALPFDEWTDEPAPRDAAPMVGNYATGLGMIAIRPKSEDLCACIVDQTVDLVPLPDGWYGLSQRSIDALPAGYRAIGEMRFATRRIDGREVMVAKRNGEEALLGEKIEPVEVPAAWRARVGRYRVTNPDPLFPVDEARVGYEDGVLYMSYRMPLLDERTIRVPLRPLDEQEAVIMGLGRMRGETLRAFMADGQEYLRYSGFVGRRVGD
jgi:CubicO group peptidase (beta-lactamase class C family)